ncbi:ABC transporter ATP-binding protein [Xanthobacter sp. V0B-10]|uniref:ABC transporter ATP-binding protein n=1 Tax=Xanthobacter albus TaxID=3119929 RepID=UPI0037276377
MSKTMASDTKDKKPILQLVGVRKTFNDFAAVERIDLDIMEGEFFTIVGPSGSGKTTMLRMLAGMEAPSEGNITLHGERINDVPANKRPTCLVFQSLALFPHMSVGQNIEFPLKIKGVDAAARKARALELMAVVRLPASYYGKNVMKCSGGERQRVALARALAYDPEVLFFDEPLSAIDYKLKKVLEKELKDLHRETGKTFIYITHSLEEAMVMSDRIGVMRAGRLVQVGTPEEIYAAPVDRFVSEFVGEVNVIELKREGEDWRGVDVPGAFRAAAPKDHPQASSAFVVVRPEYMRFLGAGEEADNVLEGVVYNEYSLGSRIQYQVRVGEKVMLVELSRAKALTAAANRNVRLGWDVRDAISVKA